MDTCSFLIKRIIFYDICTGAESICSSAAIACSLSSGCHISNKQRATFKTLLRLPDIFSLPFFLLTDTNNNSRHRRAGKKIAMREERSSAKHEPLNTDAKVNQRLRPISFFFQRRRRGRLEGRGRRRIRGRSRGCARGYLGRLGAVSRQTVSNCVVCRLSPSCSRE